MVELAEKHPDVYAEFMKGNFVMQKSARKFGLTAKDQAHEQSNKSLQAHGGAVELCENPESLTLFILTEPDCARRVEESEAVLDPPSSSTSHQEEGHSLLVKFRKNVPSFDEVVEKLGNPFLAISQESVGLDTQNVTEQAVVTSLSQIREAGQVLHATYVMERLRKKRLQY